MGGKTVGGKSLGGKTLPKKRSKQVSSSEESSEDSDNGGKARAPTARPPAMQAPPCTGDRRPASLILAGERQRGRGWQRGSDFISQAATTLTLQAHSLLGMHPA